MRATGSFRLLGFPVHVDSGLAVVLLVLVTSVHATPSILFAFAAGSVIALLTHELGHAVAARSFGASDVSISLRSLGGLTTFLLPKASRAQRAVISAAGPAVGFALGLCVWVARFLAAPLPGTELSVIYQELLFVTVGWSVINMLPVVPLDGGRLLEQLLPGSAQDRARQAGMISTAAAAIACLWFWQHGYIYSAVIFGLLTGFGVVYAVTGGGVGSARRRSPSSDAFAKVCAGDYAGAAVATRAMTRPDPALSALVEAIVAGDGAAQAQLYRLNELHPTDPMARSCLLLLRSRQSDWPGVLAMLRGQNLKLGAVVAAFNAACAAGAFTEGASIGEALLRCRQDPAIAFHTARCWSRATHPELALSALIRSVSYGWADWNRIDTDADLTVVRTTPAFRSWRATLPVAA